VECVATVTDHVDVDLATAFRFAQDLSVDFPVVTDFQGGTAPGLPFTFTVGAGTGIGLRDETGCLTLALRQDRMTLTWARVSENNSYPRFPEMKRLMLAGLKSAGLVPRTLVMSYINHVPSEQGDLLELINKELIPQACANAAAFHDINLSFRIRESTDFRWQFGRTDQGFLLSTTAGIATVDSAPEGLDEIHEALIEQFGKHTTQKAKEVWQLEHSSH